MTLSRSGPVPSLFGAACLSLVVLLGCTGIVCPRPPMVFTVDGEVSLVGGCSLSVDGTCLSELTIHRAADGRYEVEQKQEEIRYVYGDLYEGATLIWACGAEGKIGSALIRGTLEPCPTTPQTFAIPLQDELRTVMHGMLLDPGEREGKIVSEACVRTRR